MPLGELVEDFVAGPTHKVAVHQLRDDPASLQRVADSRAGNRALGDRRVEQAVVRQCLGESAVDAKGPAPVAVLLAVGDERGIGVEAVQDGLEDRVGEILRRNRAVGFNTYGEQFCGVHVNQTLTAIALGSRAAEVDDG